MQSGLALLPANLDLIAMYDCCTLGCATFGGRHEMCDVERMCRECMCLVHYSNLSKRQCSLAIRTCQVQIVLWWPHSQQERGRCKWPQSLLLRHIPNLSGARGQRCHADHEEMLAPPASHALPPRPYQLHEIAPLHTCTWTMRCRCPTMWVSCSAWCIMPAPKGMTA